MPRKQRFKPSRKPKTDQATVSNPQTDDRKEIRPEGGGGNRPSPIEEAPRKIEPDQF